MNLNSTQQCRLCLETSADPLNIYEKFHDSDIASVLIQHFRFQIDRNDDLPEWVCEICWSQTKSFHLFYKRLELRHQNHTNLVVLVKVDDIKQERSVSPMEEGLDPELTLYKCKDETDIKVEDTQLLIRVKDDCNEDNNDSNSYDQNEAEQSTDDEAEHSYDKSHSRSEVAKQDAEIRRFFAMKCDICSDDTFDTFKEVRKHYRKVHKTRSYLTCCGNKYNSRCLMLDHIQHHLNPNAYRCDQCGRSCKDRRSLQKHIKSHASINVHQCSLCPRTYTSAASLRYHVRDNHTNEKFPCDHCGKICRSKKLLDGHVRNVHMTTIDHVCDVCGRTFKTKTNLQIHTKLEHSAQPLPKVQCDICGTWLKHKARLPKHLKWHKEMQDAQEGNTKLLSCPVCKKVIQTKGLLDSHIRHVHAERKHECTFCDKAFKTSKRLKEHTALHTGAYLYSCTYCDRTFKSNANMYNHRKKVHLTEWTRDREEKDRCSQAAPNETAVQLVAE